METHLQMTQILNIKDTINLLKTSIDFKGLFKILMYNPRFEKRKTIRNTERSSEPVCRNYRISRINREENWKSMKKSRSNNRFDDVEDRPRSKGIKCFVSSPLRIIFTNHSIHL